MHINSLLHLPNNSLVPSAQHPDRAAPPRTLSGEAVIFFVSEILAEYLVGWG